MKWSLLYCAISVILMTMRPYFLLLLFPLFVLQLKKRSKHELICTIGSGIIGLVFYSLITKYFTCGAVFSSSRVNNLFGTILSGFSFLKSLHTNNPLSVESLIYIMFYSMVILMICVLCRRKNTENNEKLLAFSYMVCLLGIFFALMIFFGMDCTRHMLVICLYCVLGIIVLLSKKHAIICLLLVCVIFGYTHFDSLWGYIPTATSTEATAFTSVDDEINLIFSQQDDEGWDATMVIPFYGIQDDGSYMIYSFQNMLHVPKGYGIQIHLGTNPEDAICDSKYYLVETNSSYDIYYGSIGYKIYYENNSIVIYGKE